MCPYKLHPYLYCIEMPEQDKTYSQIAFSFEEPAPANTGLPVVQEDEPVPVATRLKAFLQVPDAVGPNPPPKPKSTRGRKALKSFQAEAELISIPEDDILFRKQYYSIGEVSDMFRVNTSLIRFWANEFDILEPRKNRKGDRMFRPIDVKNLLLIYDLLRRRKLTIEGAKDFLKNSKKAQERFELIESMRKIRNFLSEIKATL